LQKWEFEVAKKEKNRSAGIYQADVKESSSFKRKNADSHNYEVDQKGRKVPLRQKALKLGIGLGHQR
jgi:hypothetical protein